MTQLRVAALLLVAYLPSVMFAGHWDMSWTLPGAGHRLPLPVLSHAPHNHHDHDHEHQHDHDHGFGSHAHERDHHSGHCHGDMASCTSVPLTTVSPVVYLRSFAEAVSAEAVLRLQYQPTLLRPAGIAALPEIPPPRFVSPR